MVLSVVFVFYFFRPYVYYLHIISNRTPNCGPMTKVPFLLSILIAHLVRTSSVARVWREFPEAGEITICRHFNFVFSPSFGITVGTQSLP